MTYVSIFLVIAAAAPSNKKIFSDEFLYELKNEFVGKLQQGEFSDKSTYDRFLYTPVSMTACLYTPVTMTACLYTPVTMINTDVRNRVHNLIKFF